MTLVLMYVRILCCALDHSSCLSETTLMASITWQAFFSLTALATSQIISFYLGGCLRLEVVIRSFLFFLRSLVPHATVDSRAAASRLSPRYHSFNSQRPLWRTKLFTLLSVGNLLPTRLTVLLSLCLLTHRQVFRVVSEERWIRKIRKN